MRVGLNLLWLRPGRVGGSETYVARLLAGLAAAASPDLDYTLFALPAFGTGPFPTATAPLGGGARPLRLAAESTWLAARTRGLDLVHHLGGTVPVVRTAPAAVLVHDLQYTAFPEHFSPVKRAFLARAVPAAVRAAVLVTTPSEFVRGTVVDRFGVPPERVVPVPIGVTGPGGPEPGPADPAAAAAVRRRLGLGAAGDLVLYPAVTWPHKDHAVLVRAVALLPEADRPTLVLTGASGPAEAALQAEVDRLGLRPWVRRPGRVAAADLDVLYREAAAVAFPSRYEGFGAPAVEAMARGVPVVASDVTALPEVVGDAGLLVPPGDAPAWAGALAAVLADGGLRARLAAAGPARAARFSAAASAAAQEAAYRGVPAP